MDTLASLENVVLVFWTEWWIPVAVIASMTFQLILLLTGTARKRSSVLRIVAWNAYNWSDHVATLALGGMVQNAIGSTNKIYSIWAPILLLHLGAPDNISAYALEDNELWQRHGLLMILQVLAANFVVINCARGWQFVLLSTCLMVAGPIKYAERTLALCSASKAAVVESVFPIFTYMRLEHVLNLPIKGCCSEPNNDSAIDHYFYILRGELEWHRMLQVQPESAHGQSDNNNPDAYLRAVEMTSNFITLEDILADPFLSSLPVICHTCVAFALFKLYRRRFSGIHMYEWKENKTQRFFTNYSGTRPIFGATNTPETDILSVLSIELQFIYESLYTKSFRTAFTRIGIIFRIFSTLSLIASASFLRFMNTELKQQDLVVKKARLITFLLVVMALFVEICQLIRMLCSGWMRVWLACAYVQLLDKESQFKSNRTNYRPGRLLLINTLRAFTSKFLMITTINVSNALTYWPGLNCIGQYTLIGQLNGSNIRASEIVIKIDELTSQNQRIKRRIWDLLLIKHHNGVQFLTDPQFLHQFTVRLVRDVLSLCGRLSELIREKDFRYFQEFIMISKLLEKRPWRRSFEQYCVYMACNRERSGSSRSVIVSWHIATTVCEMMDESTNCDIIDSDEMVILKKNSKVLCRYLLYLLVHKAELLPCNAEIGKRAILDAQRALHSTLCNTYRYLPVTDSNDINQHINLKLLIQTLIMESPDLRPDTADDISDSSNVIDEDVQQALLQIYKLQFQYDECRKSISMDSNKEMLRVPECLRHGLMTGKLLMLGISNREERWHFIWDFWIEILSSTTGLLSCLPTFGYYLAIWALEKEYNYLILDAEGSSKFACILYRNFIA